VASPKRARIVRRWRSPSARPPFVGRLPQDLLRALELAEPDQAASDHVEQFDAQRVALAGRVLHARLCNLK
jgi:hypothetical protein